MSQPASYHRFLKGFNLQSAAGFAISGVLLWLLFKNSGLQWQQIQLHGAQWYYFAAAVAVFVFSLTLYAWRAQLIWQSPARPLGAVYAYESLVLGNFYNALLPGNLGEGMRAWHFSRKNKVPFARALAGTITEKWLDAQMFAMLTVILFCLKPFPTHYITYALAYTAAAVAALTALHLLFLYSRAAEKTVWRLVRFTGKPGRYLFRLYTHTNAHLKNMRQQGNLWRFAVFFVLIFFFNALQFYCLLKASGIQAPLAGAYAAYLIALSMMIIAFIPSAPGNVGVLHYGVYTVLILAAGQYGLVPEAIDLQHFALFGIYAHLSFLLPETLLGIVVLVKERKVIF